MTADTGGIVVSGGAGGTAADLDAMLRAAAVLGDCAGRLTAVGGRLTATAGQALDPAAIALDPGGWARAEQRVVAAAADLARLSVRAGALGAAVRTAATGYRRADRLVAEALTAARDRVAGSLGEQLPRLALRFPLGAVVVAGAAVAVPVAVSTADVMVPATVDLAGDVVRDEVGPGGLPARLAVLGGLGVRELQDDGAAASTDALGWLARHPETAEHLVAAAPSFAAGVLLLRRSGTDPRVTLPRPQAEGALPPQDVPDLAALAAAVGYGTGLLGRGPVTVRPARTPPPQPVRPPAGVADLVRGAAALAPSRDGSLPGEPGRIRVQRVQHAGTRRAIVYVPGTQTWDLGHGTNPMDATSNLDAVAGIPSAAAEGVVGALRSAGVDRSEPLLLVGYSQGGLTSMSLATDPGFRAEFTPTAVLTVGSPVGAFPAPPDVAVLSIEHAEDLITVLDGAPNPDVPTWTTVRREVLDPAGGDDVVRAAAATNPMAAHGADPYVLTAELAERTDHPSVRAWTEQVEPFLDRAGAVTSASDWVAERQP